MPERHDRLIRDDREFETAWHYIYTNPIRADLCSRAEDYPFAFYSS